MGDDTLVNAAQQVVFIDSNVSDIQDLTSGLAPGVQAFVIDPLSDGVTQIASILAANDLTNLASISIVGHGASGAIELGSSVLDDADLSDHAVALAQIGAALAPGGDLQLYACNVASGAAGPQFISDLSAFAGDATVAASTSDIGQTSTGENWTLDAAANADGTAPTPPTAPFTAAALANFSGILSSTTTELWIAGTAGLNENIVLHADDTGTGTASNVGTLFTPVSSNNPWSTESTSNKVDGMDLFQLDTQNSLYFIGSEEAGSVSAKIVEGSLASALANPTNTPTFTTLYSDNTSGQSITGVAVDPSSEQVFFVDGKSFDRVSYSGGTVTTMSTSGGPFLDGLALDLVLPAHVAYFISGGSATTTTTNGSGVHYHSVVTGSIYETSNLTATSGSSSVTISKLLDIPSATYGAITGPAALPGLTVDTKTGTVYFTSESISGGAKGGIFALNPTTKVITTLFQQNGSAGTLNSGIISSISVDDATGKYYVSILNSGGTGGAIYVGLLTGGTPTLFETMPTYSSGTVDPFPGGMSLDNAPTLTGITGTTTYALQGGAALTLLTVPPTILDSDNTESEAATIQVTNGKTGDEMFVNGVQTGTLDSGAITVSWNPATFALTLTGADSFTEYQTLLSEVSYQDTGTDTTTVGSHPTRTIAWSVSDGLLSSTVTDTTVTIERPPVQATHVITVPEGGTVGPTSANDTDLDGDTISVTSVTGGTVGSAKAGTYGSVTISGNDTYSYSATNTTAINGATSGSHPVDSFTYTVSDGSGGTALETLSFSIDRPPSAAADFYSVVSGGTVSGSNSTSGSGVLGNDSDPDSDHVSVTAVDGSAADVGASVAGTYGHLTLVASGGFSYAADQTAAINGAASGSHPVDVFSYTISDGDGDSATTSVSFTIDRAPIATAHSYELGSGATVTGTSATTGTGALGNDSDADGDTVSVTAVDGSPAGVGEGVPGTYGLLTLNANGGFTYAATSSTAINNVPTGSHPVDTFTYTISDGHGGSSTANLSFTIDRPPTVTVNATPTFTQGGAAVVLDSTLPVSAPDTNSLVSATVAVTSGGFTGDGDVLSAGVSVASITVSYNSASETLTLSGSGSVAAYQSVLDSVTFDTPSGNPANFGNDPSRTITWTVYDGEANSSSASATETLNLSLTTIYVTNGVTSTGFVISNGITLDVGSGGTASGTTVHSGGYDLVFFGGHDFGAQVSGVQYVAGYASGATVSSGGQDIVLAGGTGSGFTILSGGYGCIEVGGTTIGTTIDGRVDLNGSSLSGTISSGGLVAVRGTASATTVRSGGMDYILSGGTADATTISNGGRQDVLSSGIESGATVSSGGQEYVMAGGTSISATISSGGYGCVGVGGTASGTTVDGGLDQDGFSLSATVGSGGLMTVRGTASATTVLNSGMAYIQSGAAAVGTVISSGGRLFDLPHGIESGTTVSNGGQDYVLSGGTSISATILSGGYDLIESGGTAISAAIDGGFDLAGTALNATISSGGAMALRGTASGTTISNGGIEVVFTGATDSGATISSGGGEYVFAGGTAAGATIATDGLLELASSGSVGSGVAFAGSSGGLLVLMDSMQFSGLVAGFSGTDEIALLDIPYIAGTTTFNWSQTTVDASASGTLSVSEGANSANITLLGQYQATQFALAGYGAGTLVLDPPTPGSSAMMATGQA